MELRLLPCKVHTAERVYLARLDDLHDWPEEIDLGSRYFILSLVMDAREIKPEVVTAFAHRVLDQGLGAVDVWGPDAGRVEDLFDWACVDHDPDDVHDVVMTTSSDEGDLDDALWWATFNHFPAGEYHEEEGSLLVVVVDHPEWLTISKRG